MAESDIHRQMDDIRNDIASLRSDLSLLVESLRNEGAARGRASYQAAHDKLHESAEHIQEKMASAHDTIEHQVEARPVTSILTAFGVGFAIGLLLDRHR